MSINSPEELEMLRAAGAVVRQVLEAMKKQVRAGVSTAELDAIGDEVMRASGAQSAPRLVYQFPGSSCISLNEEAVHGIPGSRTLQAGDLELQKAVGAKKAALLKRYLEPPQKTQLRK